ncbi:hypothetical protein NDU88_002832 [Pleurodeles waltl]|uniref:Uncharacterized protein n=1 Tax=Pleurodeles waltl TaxID=8319 RepID=A0AAV7UEC1_PLEWA|nr:hypothetical protein NDU88_002832 [Pleurodeles waltl]
MPGSSCPPWGQINIYGVCPAAGNQGGIPPATSRPFQRIPSLQDGSRASSAGALQRQATSTGTGSHDSIPRCRARPGAGKQRCRCHAEWTCRAVPRGLILAPCHPILGAQKRSGHVGRQPSPCLPVSAVWRRHWAPMVAQSTRDLSVSGGCAAWARPGWQSRALWSGRSTDSVRLQTL